MALQYVSLAYRSLAEAVKYGLENEDIVGVNLYIFVVYVTLVQKLVTDAALELVKYCGYYDIEMTCQYLALYQVQYLMSTKYS